LDAGVIGLVELMEAHSLADRPHSQITRLALRTKISTRREAQ
jgi:hypothetical protein